MPVDIYEEAIEPERFGTGDWKPRLITTYLKDKYATHPIDVLVVVGTRALEFARGNREIFGSPAIVAYTPKPGEVAAAEDNVTGLQGGGWIRGNLDLALTLRPMTRRLVVIDGSRNNNGEIQAQIRATGEHAQRTGDGLSPRSAARRAPRADQRRSRSTRSCSSSARRSATRRRTWIPSKVSRTSSECRPFPSSACSRNTSVEALSAGTCGGSKTMPAGWRAMAKQIVAGATAADIPPGESTHARMLDWKQLQRLEHSSRAGAGGERGPLPPGIVFRRPQGICRCRAADLHRAVRPDRRPPGPAGPAPPRGRRIAEQRERYRSVVDAQSDLICRFLPDSTLTFVNDAYCRFWNRPRKELSDEIHRFDSGRRRARPCSNKSSVFAAAPIHRSMRSPCRTEPSAGTTGSITSSSTPADSVVELQGVGRDITDQKRAEEALGQLEARNSAILRAIPDLMFVLHRDGTYVDFHARDPTLLFVPPSSSSAGRSAT